MAVIYQPQQPLVIYQLQPKPQIGGSPQAIAACLKNLMYEQRLVSTRSYCSQLNREDDYGGWQLPTVRTGISEAAAVQACQNARWSKQKSIHTSPPQINLNHQTTARSRLCSIPQMSPMFYLVQQI